MEDTPREEWHCANCGEPSGMYGHANAAGGFSCVKKPRETRNYLQEAVAILEKKTARVVRREHLEAIAKEHAQAVANVQTVSEVIAVLMLFARTNELPVSGEKLAEVRARQTVVLVKKLDDAGNVVVTATQMKPPFAAGSGQVM